MAQMPKGEPRSVPDPVGEAMDEMSRRERFRRRHDTIMINGQLYREYDNGQANVLMPVDDPIRRAQRAGNRRAIAQAFGIAGNPLGGVAYGVAALAGATPRQRDQAFAAGAAADAVMHGAAPFGTALRGGPASPRPQVASPPLKRSNVRYRGTNADGQALGVEATIVQDMLGTGTKANPNLRTPGLSENPKADNQARGHVLARRLGGAGEEMFNLVTLTQTPTNNSHMQSFENRVARKVRNGEVVEYSVTPFYDQGTLPPRAIFLTEYGSSSPPSARIIGNPAGRRK